MNLIFFEPEFRLQTLQPFSASSQSGFQGTSPVGISPRELMALPVLFTAKNNSDCYFVPSFLSSNVQLNREVTSNSWANTAVWHCPEPPGKRSSWFAFSDSPKQALVKGHCKKVTDYQTAKVTLSLALLGIH